ncbi:MAG: F0F1 ATP synthase subunit A [Leptotrichiaceae bacterium]|nr:F0F1 ATP synthase subunit A [Leptotrichiaceae bacterium]MBP6280702.1 F0F1 ATP synthase subunit A [Leptotrichiaceae bacterium]MBP7101343.1 F0F1 ATP synthase subunit A [Leptotrichiaceae bacterium]MBP7725450.1 F0F1 ATP synthase subunit A [Leptotrichiaceae bacterium]MBP9628899.1 F0F1 ATP synthase subunit A [Leptotrichiaceae bacterium]
MGKKIGYFILILILLTVVVNIILGLIGVFLPVNFTMPEGLVEAPRDYTFIIGNMKLNLNQTILNTWAIMAIIITIITLGTRKLSVERPSKFQIVLEEYYHFIENTFLATFEEEKEKFIPFFGALFAFILFSNLSLFLFPFVVTITKGENGIYEVHHFFRTPTADPNTTVGLALIVLFVTTYTAIKKSGLKRYLKSYIEPMWFMLPLNIVEKISNVLNTSMRLFGNMLAGLVIAGLLYSLVGRHFMQSITKNLVGGPFSFSVGWPMVLQLYLDLFVGVIQAFVFTILSSVYVSESLELSKK